MNTSIGDETETPASTTSQDTMDYHSFDFNVTDDPEFTEPEDFPVESNNVDLEGMAIEELRFETSLSQLQATYSVGGVESENFTASSLAIDADSPTRKSLLELEIEETYEIRSRIIQEQLTTQPSGKTYSTGTNPQVQLLNPSSRPNSVKPICDEGESSNEGSSQTLMKSNVVIDTQIGSEAHQRTYRSPTRADTEALIGTPASTAELLWNAVQDDYESLLARFIRDDLFEIPEVHRFILAYAIFDIVLSILFPCATHLVLRFLWAAIVILTLAFVEVRHIHDIFRRWMRIKRLGRASIGSSQ